MPAVAYRDKIENVLNIFQQLNEKEKEIFYEEIKTQILVSNAKRLDSIGEPNELTMEEIVAETKAMRREQEAKEIMGKKYAQ